MHHRAAQSCTATGKIRWQAAVSAIAIHAALGAAGVEFIAENGGGAGVRLKDRSADKTPSNSPPLE